jgi:hypothetical protein
VGSGTLLGWSRFGALPAVGNTFEAAEQADESPAFQAGISLGGALLTAAGAALHSIVLVELGHRLLRK